MARRRQTTPSHKLTTEERLALEKSARLGDQTALAVLEDIQEEAGYPRERALWVTGYAKKLPGPGLHEGWATWAVSTWDGKVIGYGRAKCRPYPRGRLSHEQCTFRFNIDGKWYHGRGGGDGMVVNLRPEKPKKKYARRRLY